MRFRVFICTVLGALASFVILHFAATHGGPTFRDWVQELFVDWTWESWIIFAAMAVVPILSGLHSGLRQEGVGSILAAPFQALILGILATLLIGAVVLLIEMCRSGQIWSLVALLVIGSALMVPGGRLIGILFVEQ